MDLLIGVVAFALLALLLVSRRPRHRSPPGPAGIPLLGNIFGLPKRSEWLTYWRWSHEYGSDVVHYRILGTHVVILNSARATKDLFERRSGLYSDRPRTVMQELIGLNRVWGFLGYGDRWRAHRKLFHQYFRDSEIPNYYPQMRKSVHQLLGLLCDSPQNLFDKLSFATGSNILDVVYASGVEREDDPILDKVKNGMHVVSEVGGNSGTFLVDVFPLLRSIPSWVPGAGFKRQADRWKVMVDGMFEYALQHPKAALKRGEERPCVAADMMYELRKYDDAAEREEVIINVTGTAYGAALDTTTASLASFILSMIMHSDIQKAAHAELDSVIGRSRLPEMQDKDSLPYITAVLYEIFRWRPVLPLGSPHRLLADDEYEGYHIPAGSIVFGNSWAILHDEKRYPDPDTFNPARFLTSEGELSKDVPFPAETFGYSRRVCPGRHFAQHFLWLAIANILATYEIEPFVDEKGNVEMPSGKYTSGGMFSYPEEFKAKFKPRSPKVEHK